MKKEIIFNGKCETEIGKSKMEYIKKENGTWKMKKGELSY
jgi:hypothetical protein